MNVCISYMPCPAKAPAPAKALPSQPARAAQRQRQAANQPRQLPSQPASPVNETERPMKFPYVINVQMTEGKRVKREEKYTYLDEKRDLIH
jgi:hypothetical protein